MRISLRDSLAASVSGIYKPPVVVQSNDYDAWGLDISIFQQNNKSNFKYQNQERINDFGIGLDLFKFRPSDYQIGRFWQSDPLSSDFPHNSLYAFQENKFGLGVELEGRDLGAFLTKAGDFMAGTVAAWTDNQILVSTGIREANSRGRNESAYNAGQTFGDALSMVQGAAEAIIGLGGSGGAALATVASGGTLAPAAIPVAVASAGIATHGISVGVKASKNLSDRMVNSEGEKKGSYTPKEELPRKKDNTPKPDSEAKGAHTQPGTKQGSKGEYRQAREFDKNGKPVKDIDFTDHGRPQNHPNPHQHKYVPNSTGGTMKRGSAEPLN